MSKTLLIVVVVVLVVLAWRAGAAATNDAAAAWAAIAKGALLVDVRTEREFKQGHLDGALNIPHGQVGERLAEFGTDKARPIVVHCHSGRRSGIAKAELEKNGYSNVINGGGFDQMRAAKPAPEAK